MTGRLRFEPVPSGTRLSWDWDVPIGAGGRVLGPLIAVIGRRQERAIWEGLTRYLEDGATCQHPQQRST